MEAGEEDEEPARKEVTTGPLVALGPAVQRPGFQSLPVTTPTPTSAHTLILASWAVSELLPRRPRGPWRSSAAPAPGPSVLRLPQLELGHTGPFGRKLSNLKALTRQARPTPKLRFLIPVGLTPPQWEEGRFHFCSTCSAPSQRGSFWLPAHPRPAEGITDGAKPPCDSFAYMSAFPHHRRPPHPALRCSPQGLYTAPFLPEDVEPKSDPCVSQLNSGAVPREVTFYSRHRPPPQPWASLFDTLNWGQQNKFQDKSIESDDSEARRGHLWLFGKQCIPRGEEMFVAGK
eukprot:bmy_21760T0